MSVARDRGVRTYDIAVPPRVALAEWLEFARNEALVRALGEVSFEPVEGERSSLSIRADDGEPLGVDAVVQRFRERLRRRGLA